MNHALRLASGSRELMPRVTRFCRSGTPARHDKATGKSARPTDKCHEPIVTSSLGLSFLLVAALAVQAPAQTILVDDFNDGTPMAGPRLTRPLGGVVLPATDLMNSP